MARNSPSGSDDQRQQTGINSSRRNLLKAGAGAVTLGTFAGCAGSTPGSGGGGGESNTVKAAFLYPTSGTYGAVGQDLKRGAKLALKHTVERDSFQGNIEPIYRDTKTKPSVGTKRAREVINNEGADIIFGAWSSSVGLAIQRVVKESNIPFQTYIGTNKITGARCSKYTFDLDPSAAQQANGTVGYALSQNPDAKVFQIYADYAWGQSHNNYLKNSIVPRYDGAEFLGAAPVPLGKGEYSDVISEAKQSGADIVYMTLAGTDAQAGIKQAARFGLMDQAVTPFPLVSGVIGKGVSQEALAHENFIGGTPYHWTLDNQTNNKFVKEFRNEFNRVPFGYAGVGYESVRTTFDALGKVGGPTGSAGGRKSNFPLEDWRSEMEGKTVVPGIHERGIKFRACDHRGTITHLAARGLPPSEADQASGNIYKIVNQPDDPLSLMRKCSETGCSL